MLMLIHPMGTSYHASTSVSPSAHSVLHLQLRMKTMESLFYGKETQPFQSDRFFPPLQRGSTSFFLHFRRGSTQEHCCTQQLLKSLLDLESYVDQMFVST